MIKPLFTGCGIAMITPFNEDGVNRDALDKLTDYLLENAADALIACGTTGEPSTLTDAEKDLVIAGVVRRVNGRVPVIAGTGGNDTRAAVLAAHRAAALGADAQLCVTPYYNKTTQRGLLEHYLRIADDGSLPVIIYNVPSRTGLNMTPQTLETLSRHENIIAMKEASGDITQCADMVRLCDGRLSFYAGNDDMLLPCLALGFHGVISVAGNIIPRAMGDIVRRFAAGDIEGARELQYRFDPLIDALFLEVNPIPVKTAATLMGFEAGPLRLPLFEMSAENLAVLTCRMRKAGLIP